MLAWPRALDWGKAAGLAPTDSIRLVVVALAGAAFVFCMIPFFAVDERRFVSTAPTEQSLKEALRTTLRNRPFVIYLAAHILFSLSASLIFPTLPYLATVLLGRSEGFAFDLGAALGGMMGVGFVVIPRISQRFGPRRTMLSCFALFALAAASLGMIRPDVPQGPEDWRNLVLAFTAMGAMGLPLASSSLLHNVLVGQIIDLDARHTGSNRSAIFLGVLRALDKWMYGLAAAIIGFLFARFGNGPDEPMGVLLIGPIGGVLALSASMVLSRFPDLAAQAHESP